MNFLTWLYSHKTKITGGLLVAAGALQANATSIQAVVKPHTYAWFTVGVGVVVAILGFLNGTRKDQP
jgi:hypothetical protein